MRGGGGGWTGVKGAGGMGEEGTGDEGAGVGKFLGRGLYQIIPKFVVFYLFYSIFMYFNAITGYQKYLIDVFYFFCFFTFIHFPFSPVPLFHLPYYLLSLLSLSLGDDTKWLTRVDVSLNPNSTKSITCCLVTKHGPFTDLQTNKNSVSVVRE